MQYWGRDNKRFGLLTPVPRGILAWQNLYRYHTAVERSFNRKKVDYDLEAARVRSTSCWHWRAHLVAFNQHLDAQTPTTNPSRWRRSCPHTIGEAFSRQHPLPETPLSRGDGIGHPFLLAFIPFDDFQGYTTIPPYY